MTGNQGTSERDTASNFAKRVEANQRELAASLKPTYDFVVCGAGSSGSVVARRLAENPAVTVLLLEAGGTDDIPEIQDPSKWVFNLGSEREWGFQTEPSPNLNGRSIPYAMGKALGGGSSINVLVWSRGHQTDWDYFAEVSGDEAWAYDSILRLYRRIEDYHGAADQLYRGSGGPIYLQNASSDLHPFNEAVLQAAETAGLPRFKNPNGSMMESTEGCSTTDRILRCGRRQSVFRSYPYPLMDQPNLTVLTGALVTRITFTGKRATGIELFYDRRLRHIEAGSEVIVSLGAVQTPKVLMQSGIGNQSELERFNIPVVEHLPGVGQNLQDHPNLSCVWEFSEKQADANILTEAVAFWRSDPSLASPDLLIFPLMVPYTSAENMARYQPPEHSWTLASVLLRPKSRGQIRLTGPNPSDRLRIEANILSDPADLQVALSGIATCREIGSADALEPFRGKEILPGNLKYHALEHFVREGVGNFSHQSCTAKMGRDAMSVVDAHLRVYGIDNLRIADASIMPRITTGNTMAPCVVIGERASDLLRTRHGL
jgi:choline dehydrogenase